MKNNNKEVIEKLKEFIQKTKEISSRYNNSLSKREKEKLAESIESQIHIILGNIDFEEEVYKKYSSFMQIEHYANDLEWSNSIDINKDWQELIGYINELEEQVNNPKSSNQSQSSQD